MDLALTSWDTPVSTDILPMWVADMDFLVAPAIDDALRRRVDQGIFGYTKVPDEYYASLIDWFGMQHGFKIKRHEVIYTSGVVPAISAIIKALCKPGDKVITRTPPSIASSHRYATTGASWRPTR